MSELQNLSDIIFDENIPFINRYEEVFQFQVLNNPVYQRFASVFGFGKHSVPDPAFVPFLPIRAFREAKLLPANFTPELMFKSSGTSAMKRSTHYVGDAGIYSKAIKKEFYRHFPLNEFAIFSYTPGYSANPDSSLVWMVEELIENDTSELSRLLPLQKPITRSQFDSAIEQNRRVLLFGAAFGLLDLLEMGSPPLPEDSVIIETGGMKTYRREISKAELRETLSEGFQVPLESVCSEYGMCELLSQFYAVGSEWFISPHWTKVSVRRADDPSKPCNIGEEGKIAIIDLANTYSCPFILTDDRGIMDAEGRFKVLGRWNQGDLRGCNFLIDHE